MRKTIKDLMGTHKSAEIRCMYRGELVRRLTVDGNVLHLDAITDKIDLPLDTELILEPWVFDRGSILCETSRGRIKFCGEMDPITFDDGSEERVTADFSN